MKAATSSADEPCCWRLAVLVSPVSIVPLSSSSVGWYGYLTFVTCVAVCLYLTLSDIQSCVQFEVWHEDQLASPTSLLQGCGAQLRQERKKKSSYAAHQATEGFPWCRAVIGGCSDPVTCLDHLIGAPDLSPRACILPTHVSRCRNPGAVLCSLVIADCFFLVLSLSIGLLPVICSTVGTREQ